jgi:hypothetical protein
LAKKKSGTKLKFVRMTDGKLVPRYLLEQIKPKAFNIDLFYQYSRVIFSNPLNYLGGFVDRDNEIKGVVWFSYNPIEEAIFVHLMSVAPEYFGKGALTEARNILKRFYSSVNAKRAYFTTDRPTPFTRLGYTTSPVRIMEIKG